VQIEGEEGDGQGDSHAREGGDGVEGQGGDGGHPQLEYPLGDGHLPAVPLHRPATGTPEVQGIRGRIVEGHRLQQTALDLVEGSGANAVRTAEGNGTLKRNAKL